MDSPLLFELPLSAGSKSNILNLKVATVIESVTTIIRLGFARQTPWLRIISTILDSEVDRHRMGYSP